VNKEKPGPKEDRLKLEDDWYESIGKALKKKRPADGWPKIEEKQKDSKK
jgi:hypothetical protein